MSRSAEIKLLVKKVRQEAVGVVALALHAADGSALPAWEPGAHISLALPCGSRQYSLCGDPADVTSYDVAVLLSDTSRGGSLFIHDQLTPGSVVTCREPRNNFPLVEAEKYRFIAGGIGITPLLPMLRKVEAEGKPWHLYYGGRSMQSMAFVAELEAYGEKVTFVPQDRHGLLDLDTILADAHDTRVYCCGPEPLLRAVEQRCTAVPTASLHIERFDANIDATEWVNTPFEVVCETSGMTVEVSADQTMLDALLSAGVEVDSDCEEGICGTCELKVVSGRPEHRDDILTDDERTYLILPCVSRIFGERIVVEA